MPPTIHCVRHAQGYHNLSLSNHHLPDPLLTPHGGSQCLDLQRTFPSSHRPILILASPLNRTLHTALLSFSTAISSANLRVTALPDLQETSDLPCDTGSPLADLQREFTGKPVDLSLVREGWERKVGRNEPTKERIEGRAREARRWIAEKVEGQEEGDVVVVTHGGFLHYFTEDWSDSDRFQGTGWANTEFRSYTFDPKTLPSSSSIAPDQPPSYSLVETPQSRARRAGTEKALSEAEQRNLKQTAHNSWEKAGYQRRASTEAGEKMEMYGNTETLRKGVKVSAG